MSSLWLKAFFLTLLTEALVVGGGMRSEPLSRRLSLALYANLATHPLVWFVLPDLCERYLYTWLLSEAFAVGAEAGLYRLTTGLSAPRALALSLAANTASVLVGELAYRVAPVWMLT